MTRGRYEVTALGEEDAAAGGRPGRCRCSRQVRLLLLVTAVLLLLLLAAAVTAAVLLQSQAQHSGTVFPADSSRLYRGGTNITEGDMLGFNTSSGERSGKLDPRRLWPLGRVPYRVDPAIGCPHSARCGALMAAMEEYRSRTCVQWSRSEQPHQPELQIRYRPDSGCYAHVGYRGSADVSQPQLLVLGNGCFNRGILLHLLGHTLGMWHEHNRPDRDSWLDVNMANVDWRYTDSFRKFSDHQHRVVDQLDFSSVMMFGGEAFSNGGGPTMAPHHSRGPLLRVDQKTQLSEQDAHRVQVLYIRLCSRRDRQAKHAGQRA